MGEAEASIVFPPDHRLYIKDGYDLLVSILTIAILTFCNQV